MKKHNQIAEAIFANAKAYLKAFDKFFIKEANLKLILCRLENLTGSY